MAASEQPSDIVLYIEDNPVNLKLASILVDLSMPGMDGFQVLEILKTEPELADTPIIAMSAHALPEDIHRGKAAGFDDYLTKPVKLNHFFEVLDRYLVER